MWESEVVKQTKSLFISAGHSHKDPGAYGNGYTEADIVLDFRDAVADALRGRVSFAKDGDRGENLPLSEAVAMAKNYDVAVEFHCNAFKDPRARGVETLSQSRHYALGAKLTKVVSDTLGTADRGPKSSGSGQHNRLAFADTAGGIILELFFLTNAKDVEAYKAHRGLLAKRVANVLVEAVHGSPA